MVVVRQIETSTVDSIIQEYGIKVESTKLVKLNKARLSKDTRIFEVEHSSLHAYIIDTPMTRRVACHPHVVGDELEGLVSQAAERSLPPIFELSEVNEKSSDSGVVFEQILRAAPGYQLHQAATKTIPDSFRTVYIRPRYTHTSYRDHDGMIQRQLNIVYEDFSLLPAGKKISIIMQDTVASSRSAEISIQAAIERCERVNSRIEKWILYGFISLEGLKLLDKLAQSHDIPMIAFAMGNLTAMCANNYDMPLFGVDEWFWQKEHSIRRVGALVDTTTLTDYIQEFIPGSDQPGDWSARQTQLFNGRTYESGNIRGHLENSIRLIKSLIEIGNLNNWQKQLAATELNQLNKKLEESYRDQDGGTQF
jgi:hypothetical protein